MPQQQLPRMFDHETIMVGGSEWELCRAKMDDATYDGHVLKLRFGDQAIFIGLSNNDGSEADKEREEIARYIVFAAAQLAQRGKK